MSLIRTIGFTLCMTVLVTLLIARSIMEISIIGMFLIIAVIGLALYFIFGPEEYAQSISIVFISSAIVLIVAGFSANGLQNVLTQFGTRMEMVASHTNSSQEMIISRIISIISEIFKHRNILVELMMLFVGLFGSASAVSYFKEKEKPDYGIMLRSVLGVAVIYLLALIINYIAMSHVVSTGAGIA